MVQIKSLGADPEIFIKSNERVLSAIGMVGGTKKEPRPIEKDPEFGIQEDNVAVEMTIPPSFNKEDFILNIKKSVHYAHGELPEGVYLSKECFHLFDADQLDSDKACEFGCSPEIDAYTGQTYTTKLNENMPNLRTCGGHVHIGMDKVPRSVRKAFVRCLDLFLGVPSLILEGNNLRRELYGKAGSCRFKKYGLEYRVLSNFWIFEDSTIDWVWESVHAAAKFFNENQEMFKESYFEIPLLVKHVIDNCDQERATQLIENYKIPMPNGYSDSNPGETGNRKDTFDEELRSSENSVHQL
jgi:hypothetical protein